MDDPVAQALRESAEALLASFLLLLTCYAVGYAGHLISKALGAPNYVEWVYWVVLALATPSPVLPTIALVRLVKLLKEAERGRGSVLVG